MAAGSTDRAPTTGLNRWLRGQALKLLGRFRDCHVEFIDGHERLEVGEPGAPLATIVSIHSPDTWRALTLGGTLGAAEAYLDGLWDASDLAALTAIFVRNRVLMDELEGGFSRFFQPALRMWSWARRNHRSGARRNIEAHYDLGNDLFELFLDENLMYSSAVYAPGIDHLETASTHKLDRICRKLDLKPADHVLEIGTGWGGFAIHAARHYGCRVTTTTISSEQYELAGRRFAAAGLSDRITLLKQDYRDLTGSYDKLVSIEMIEAVGYDYLPTYTAALNRLVKADGLMLLQAITIEDARFKDAVRKVDFIKRYIFPGSFIPSVTAILEAMSRTSDCRLFHLEDIGPSYARTLAEWSRRFESNLDRVRALGYPERFIRMWRYYLAYCEGGFRERVLGNAQMLFVKPDNRRPELLPAL